MNHLTVQQLSAALDGALGGPSLELVVHHLAHCHECRDRQAGLARNDDALRRLLSHDPHDFFLDDLERRVEALTVAIMRGLPVPPMVTSSPLQSEEDPYASAEPPLPARPELGPAGAIAHEAGFGRIGLKPTASSQAPMADPAEAQRLLEALERGETGDFTELTAQDQRDHASVDGPKFDLPGWIKQASGTPKPGEAPRPREVQKLELFFEHLNDRNANLPHDAVEEVFRREGAAQAESPVRDVGGPPLLPFRALPAPPAPAPVTPATPAAAAPAVPVVPAPRVPAAADPPVRLTPLGAPSAPEPHPLSRQLPFVSTRPSEQLERPDVVTKETPWRRAPAWTKAGGESSPPFQPPHQAPVTDAYEQVNEPRRRPVPRVKPTPRFAAAWLLATASVGGLLVLLLVLQFLPPADSPGATAWRGFRLPNIRFAPGDSTAPLDAPSLDPALHSATTPFPVESPVPGGEFPLDGSPVDSTGLPSDSLATAADTLGPVPGR